MKNRKGLALSFVVAAALLVVSIPTFAKAGRKVTIGYDATIGGSAIPQGVYEVSWEMHSPQATVTFAVPKHKQVIATVEGKVVERDKTCTSNGVVFSINPDGTRTIIELRFAGMKQVIVFGAAASTSMPAKPQARASAALLVPAQSAAASLANVRFLGKASTTRANLAARSLDEQFKPEVFHRISRLP